MTVESAMRLVQWLTVAVYAASLLVWLWFVMREG